MRWNLYMPLDLVMSLAEKINTCAVYIVIQSELVLSSRRAPCVCVYWNRSPNVIWHYFGEMVCLPECSVALMLEEVHPVLFSIAHLVLQEKAPGNYSLDGILVLYSFTPNASLVEEWGVNTCAYINSKLSRIAPPQDVVVAQSAYS